MRVPFRLHRIHPPQVLHCREVLDLLRREGKGGYVPVRYRLDVAPGGMELCKDIFCLEPAGLFQPVGTLVPGDAGIRSRGLFPGESGEPGGLVHPDKHPRVLPVVCPGFSPDRVKKKIVEGSDQDFPK